MGVGGSEMLQDKEGDREDLMRPGGEEGSGGGSPKEVTYCAASRAPGPGLISN